MGTNFYWTKEPCPYCKQHMPVGSVVPASVRKALEEAGHDPDFHGAYHYATHLGKRSGAGAYCWDCGQTLCMGGEPDIHYGRTPWHAACPKCGKKKGNESVTSQGNAAGVELGFAEVNSSRPRGVQSCCSFGWAQPPEAALAALEERRDQLCVEDEYGRVMTAGAFLDMLENQCPVRFTDSIGVCFS